MIDMNISRFSKEKYFPEVHKKRMGSRTLGL